MSARIKKQRPKRTKRLSAALLTSDGLTPLDLSPIFYQASLTLKSERNRFAAVRGTKSAPNAKRAFALKVNARLDIGKAVRIDRFGDEANRTVKQTGVDAARVIARRGEQFNLPLLAIVLHAGRSVRRHNRRESGQDRETVKPVAATRMRNVGLIVFVRFVGVARIHAQARLGNPSASVEVGIVAA